MAVGMTELAKEWLNLHVMRLLFWHPLIWSGNRDTVLQQVELLRRIVGNA